MATIRIEGMDFFAYHGCFKEESIIGTRFEVDLTVTVDTEQAEISDDLHKTVNYMSLYDAVKNEMDIRSNLLENVAFRILKSIRHRFPIITRAEIKISKLNPPIGGKAERVSVTMIDEHN
ncbi:MAG TPA: dihydroneopterin aldolase [Lentimicrobium sp.]|nr:dihydroneopterin aldolase [Lentimicrobium sp.]